MIRFILFRKTYNGANNHIEKCFETLDANCPELEALLRRGGFGGGPNNDDYDATELIGAEVRDAALGGKK